jgi:hypothetical protein
MNSFMKFLATALKAFATIDALSATQLLHRPVEEDGILIPHYWPGETKPHGVRIYLPNGTYAALPGTPGSLFFPAKTPPQALANVTLPVLLVEDELTAIFLSRRQYSRKSFLAAAICGGWEGLERLSLQGRSVCLLLDRDVDHRPLREELRKRGALVAKFVWPDGVSRVRDLWPRRLQPTTIEEAIEKLVRRVPKPRIPEIRRALQTRSDSLAAYKAIIRRFVAERCFRHRRAKAPGAELYAAYRKWQGHGFRLTRNAFGQTLKTLYPKSRNRKGVRYHGIGLPGISMMNQQPVVEQQLFLNEEFAAAFGASSSNHAG